MPQRVLQTLRQRREALAAEHHPGMGEARLGETEVIEHVIQRLPGDSHAERPHAGEVGQALPARLMLLAEDHVLFGTVLGAPDADPPLQGTPHPRAELGTAAHQLLEHADRADARTVLENRHDVRFEDIGQRIRPSPAARLALSGRRYGKVAALLKRVEECRNRFSHGHPEAIDDAVVEALVAGLKDEHEDWRAVFNRRLKEARKPSETSHG